MRLDCTPPLTNTFLFTLTSLLGKLVQAAEEEPSSEEELNIKLSHCHVTYTHTKVAKAM